MIKQYYHRFKTLTLLCCLLYFSLIVTDYQTIRQHESEYEIMKLGYILNAGAMGGYGEPMTAPDPAEWLQATGLLKYKWKYPYLGYPVADPNDAFITSEKGWRWIFGQKEHVNSTDWICLTNLQVLSMIGSHIKEVEYNDRVYGNYIKTACIVKYLDRIYQVEIKYSHLSMIYVKKNQSVLKGMIIGVQGNTGRTTKRKDRPFSGVHLDLEIKIDGVYVNPFSNAIINKKIEP